jgi:hypothetical protein
MGTKKISACLVSREAINPSILDSLDRFGFDEVLVGGGTAYGVSVYGRYEAAFRARNDLIYTQDDDFLVFTLDRLFQKWDGRFVAHHNVRFNLLYRTPFTTVGYGAIFHRDVVFSAFDFYEKHFGRDAYFYRGCDLIATGLCQPIRANFAGASLKSRYSPSSIGVNLPNSDDASRIHNRPDQKTVWNEKKKVRTLTKLYTAGINQKSQSNGG